MLSFIRDDHKQIFIQTYLTLGFPSREVRPFETHYAITQLVCKKRIDRKVKQYRYKLLSHTVWTKKSIETALGNVHK